MVRRRSRLFLAVLVILVVALYEASRLKSWDSLTDLSTYGVPHNPAKSTLSVAASLPTRSVSAAPVPASTRSGWGAASTITGEELLEQKPLYHDESSAQHGQSRLDVKQRPGKPKARWRPPVEHFPIKQVKQVPEGEARSIPRIQHKFGSEPSGKKMERIKKQTAVREAFKHAWGGYKRYAYGHDELRPISNGTTDPFNGWGATLVDALDTLWIMGLKEDFEDAVRVVGKIDFKTSPRKDIPLFETTIRYLGGLLAAYDISANQYTILLDKAVELADVVIGAFDTPNRMPVPYYQWAPSYASQPHRASPHIVMAELGSLAMEFTRLSQLTREHKYYDAIARVTDALELWQMKTTYPGVWPVRLDASGCRKPEVDKIAENNGALQESYGEEVAEDMKSSEPDSNFAKRAVPLGEGEEPAIPLEAANSGVTTRQAAEDMAFADDEDDDDTFNVDCDPQGLSMEPHSKSYMYSLSAMADSTYEYFPKMHALLGGLNKQYRNMYNRSMEVIRADFLYRPMIKEKRDILFIAKHKQIPKAESPAERKETIYEGTHLGCFVGGMFALGSKVFDIPSDMKLAEKLTDACVWAYESTPLDIMPEEFQLVPCEDRNSCSWNETRWHEFLDPLERERFEAVELYNSKQEALLVTTDEDSEPHEVDTALLPPNERQGSGKGDPGSESSIRDETLFHPKVALSHAKYVQARISEERLPAGYTSIEDREYKLRPEAIESVFIMYRLTGEQGWREKGWKMFTAVERATRTRSGHAAVKDVTSSLGKQADAMESFWLAETLKYYYLLFSEETLVSLDDYIFNTEAHPFSMPQEGTSLL